MQTGWWKRAKERRREEVQDSDHREKQNRSSAVHTDVRNSGEVCLCDSYTADDGSMCVPRV